MSKEDENKVNKIAPENVRKIRNFTNVASNTFNNATNIDDEADEHEDEMLHDSDRFSNQISDSARRVKDFVENEKRRKLEEDRNAGNINSYGTDDRKNITRPEIGERKEASDIELPRRQLNDSKDIERINDAAKNNIDYKALEENFEVPKKRESFFKAIKEKKDTYFAEKKAKFEAAKKEGWLNRLVKKITGESAKTAIGVILKIVIIIVIVVLTLALFTSIIMYFANNYTRDQDNIADSKRLDTRAARAIFALGEQKELTDLYKELVNGSSGEQQRKYILNRDRLLPSDEVEKLKAAENPDDAYILLDDENWVLLYLERLSYAWGGYLDWIPDYIDLGVNTESRDVREAAGENVSRWFNIAEEVGLEYGIDPYVLLTIVDIESAGDPHAGNSNYKGLCALGENFKAYFNQGDEYYSWSVDQRLPHDTGSCNIYDESHQRNAKFHMTYVARRLTKDMRDFITARGSKLETASDELKTTALLYAITSYNQGENYEKALYGQYGKNVYLNNGEAYKDAFLKHKTKALEGGYKSIGKQENYLILAYKFYEAYAHKNLAEAASNMNTSKWYGTSVIRDLNIEANTPGSVQKDVKLVKDSTEIDLVNQIKQKYYEDETRYIVNQYNTQMKMMDDYYQRNYPEKFIHQYGMLVPEIYAKDEYGMNTPNVIKYVSYIHSSVDNHDKFVNPKTYGGTIDEAYADFQEDLYEENNFVWPESIQEPGESLNDLEDDIAINRYEMSFEVLRTVDGSNEIFTNAKSIDTILNSLKYSVPIYEYVSVNPEEGKLSFFDYETYSPENYNSDYTLKIDKSKFINYIQGIFNINISMKSFVKNGYSDAARASVESRMQNAFEYMYLNTENTAYEPKNHSVEYPDNVGYYYLFKNGRIYDKMIENAVGTEIWMLGEPTENVEWREVSSIPGEPTFKCIESTTTRDYYLSSLKPNTYTGLKYKIDFEYIKVESGTKEIREAEPIIKYYEGTCYATEKDENGNSTGEKYETGKVYKKEVTRTTTYEIEKVRDKIIRKREG